VTAKGLSALYAAVAIGKPITIAVLSLNMRGDSTKKDECLAFLSKKGHNLQGCDLKALRNFLAGTYGFKKHKIVQKI